MSKKSLFVLIFVLVGGFAFASAKLSRTEYWAATGLSATDLNRLPYFTQESCTQSLKNFRGCIAGISAIAKHASSSLVLVPRSTVAQTSVKKDFGPLVFVAADLNKLPNNATFYDRWQIEKIQTQKNDAAVSLLFKSDKSKVGFPQILKFAMSVGITDRSKESSIIAAALNAYVIEAFDPHSHFDANGELLSEAEDAGQHFSGIGAIMTAVNGRVIVQSPIEGSPALKAGLRANDVILKVNETSTVGMDFSAVVSTIRGPTGSRVNLHILRGDKQMSLSVVRGKISLENLTAKLLVEDGNKVGYIKLRSFMEENSCSRMSVDIQKLQAAGAKSFILDLRDNGGGLLGQGICIGELFVGQKTIVQVKDLQSNVIAAVPGGYAPQFTRLPMIVMINAGSASASEIVAGALQDYQRAWILGERSFGKATVQEGNLTTFNPNITLFKTVERFYQPSGRTNQIQGIRPDFVVPVKPGATKEERFALREGDLFSNAFEALGKPWKQPRPEIAAQMKSCMGNGFAEKQWASHANDAILPDYQLFAAESAAKCAQSIGN